MGLYPNKEENKGLELNQARNLPEEASSQGLHPAGELKADSAATQEPAATAPSQAAAPAFVLNIDGEAPKPEKAPELPTLTGGTGTLPRVNENPSEKPLVSNLEQSLADTVRKAVEAAQSARQAEKPVETPKPDAGKADANPAPAQAKQTAAPPQPSAPAQEQLANMSYASMAEAVQQARKEPTGRYSREAVDDETLLAELYTLIGDGNRNAPVKPAPRTETPAYEARTAARITPDTLKDLPEEEEVYLEEDSTGAPGWLKGIFILLISLLLSAMTFYAVASDVIGEIF